MSIARWRSTRSCRSKSWTIDALLVKDGINPFTARLVGRRGDKDTADREKLELGTEAEAKEVIAALGLDDNGAVTARTPAFIVQSIEVKERSSLPQAPHTTSTLQQDASSRLGMPPKRAMSIAQQLYEGVDLGSAGSTGLITYMRTNSIRISDAAKDAARKHITTAFGKEYVGTGAVRGKKAALNVQDAHEAIRPTDVSRTPESVSADLSRDQLRLYDLIWRRFVASQMSPAKILNTSAMIDAADYVFRASGSVVTFEGFQKVWKRDDDKDKDMTLPVLVEKEALNCVEITSEQHFTQPPPRYTEATLIKELEERGIGRPSTYAATIEVIQERQYVKQVERRLHPTELGKTVDTVLRQNFPDIVDIAFTADLEKRLNSVEEGTREYEPTVREWYEPFAETLERAERSMERVRVPARETGEECPECEIGRLVVREGKFGEFVGCSRFPDCTYIKDRKKSEAIATGEACPICAKPLVTRQGRRGPFVGCSGYPSCTYIKSDAPGPGGRRRRRHARGAGSVPHVRQAAGAAEWEARILRRMHRLSGLQVHPAGRRRRSAGRPDARADRRSLPRMLQTAGHPSGPIRTVRQLLRLSRLQVPAAEGRAAYDPRARDDRRGGAAQRNGRGGRRRAGDRRRHRDEGARLEGPAPASRSGRLRVRRRRR